MGTKKHMVADLHCDLLSYLAKSRYHLAYDDESRASIGQLLGGKVFLQALAVFAKTGPSSVRLAMRQVAAYKELPVRYGESFSSFHDKAANSKIKTLLAFENASTFCSEKEPLSKGMDRLQRIVSQMEKPLYISLTWKDENRFGGGDTTHIGLKDDGKKLLYKMQELSYAIDLSHASDKLAHDIFTFIDKEKLTLACMASHSNFRTVHAHPRNMPEEIVLEMALRGGLIGLNLITIFLGRSIESFLHNIEWALKHGLGGNICLGADFFADAILPASYALDHEPFFVGFGNASCYPKLLALVKKQFGNSVAANIASGNVHSWIKRNIESRSGRT